MCVYVKVLHCILLPVSGATFRSTGYVTGHITVFNAQLTLENILALLTVILKILSSFQFIAFFNHEVNNGNILICLYCCLVCPILQTAHNFHVFL